MNREYLPVGRRAIKTAALLIVSLGLLAHILTTYENPLVAGALVVALAVIDALCAANLWPRPGVLSWGHAHQPPAVRADRAASH